MANTNAQSAGGAGVIYDDDMADVFEYTGKSGTTSITGVTGLGFAHEDGDELTYMYALQSNFQDIRGDTIQIAGQAYTFVDRDPIGTQYSLYTNGTTTFLWLPRSVSGDFSVSYNKNTTTIDGTADNIDLPDNRPEDHWFLVYRLCEYASPLLEKDANFYKVKADLILNRSLKNQWVGKRPRTVRSAEHINRLAGVDGNTRHYNAKVGSFGAYV